MTKNLPLAFYIDLNGPKTNFDLNRKKTKTKFKAIQKYIKQKWFSTKHT